MSVRLLLTLSLASTILVGCKGSREKDVIGSWSASETSLTAAEDKTFKSTGGLWTIEGNWSMDKDDVSFMPETINGKTISEVKSLIQRQASRFPAQAKTFADDLDKPNVLLLSSDGKTMTTDKAKDTNAGPAVTLTKQAG